MTGTIAHVIPGLEPGGAEAILLQVVAALPTWQHHVISLKAVGPLAAPLREAGAHVHGLNMQPGKPTPAGSAALWKVLRQAQPAVLQGWMYHGNLAALAGAQALWPRPRVFWSIHNAAPQLPGSPWHTRLTARANGVLCGQVEKVIYVARSSMEAHERSGFSRQRSICIPGGVDTDRLRPNPEAAGALRTRLNLPADVHLVGIVARHDPLKDHPTFLRAAAVVDDPKVHFVVAGAGLDGPPIELRPLIGAPLQRRLHWLGLQSDVGALLQGLDVCTLSSTSEALPMVLLEALACGTLAVATDVGDCGALLARIGWVVTPRSPAALASAWHEALQCGSTEQETRRAMGRARVLQNYSRQRLAERYEALYAQGSQG